MTTGPRASHVFLAAFFASFVGGGLGAGLIVSYVASDMKRTAAEAAADAVRRSEEERRRAEEEAAKRRGDDAEAKRRAEEDEARRGADEATRRRVEEQRRREDEARRRNEEERRRAEAPGTVISCDDAVAQLKGVFTHETDCYYFRYTFRVALDSNRDGSPPSTWRNARNGTTGTVRVLDTSRLADGTMCRRFEQMVTISGRTISGTGTACHRDGKWQIES